MPGTDLPGRSAAQQQKAARNSPRRLPPGNSYLPGNIFATSSTDHFPADMS